MKGWKGPNFEQQVAIYREGMIDRRAVIEGLPSEPARREAMLRMIEEDEAHTVERGGKWTTYCWPGDTDHSFPWNSKLKDRRLGRFS